MFRSKARQFELDFKFKVVLRPDPKTGVEEAFYVGLEFAK